MPYRQIREISDDADSGYLYLVVDFWLTKAGHDNGNPPFLTNDFVMQISPTETRIITDANGFWQRASDGVFIDPATLAPDDTTVWATETVQRPRADIIAEIKGNVRDYFVRAIANRWAGDHTGDETKPFFVNGVQQRKKGQRRARVAQDIAGLLQDAQIAALAGSQADL